MSSLQSFFRGGKGNRWSLNDLVDHTKKRFRWFLTVFRKKNDKCAQLLYDHGNRNMILFTRGSMWLRSIYLGLKVAIMGSLWATRTYLDPLGHKCLEAERPDTLNRNPKAQTYNFQSLAFSGPQTRRTLLGSW